MYIEGLKEGGAQHTIFIHAIMWSYEVWSESDVHIVKSCWWRTHILLATWVVNFALVDEREKNKMQNYLDELGEPLISKLQLGDVGMSIETYIDGKGREH